MASFMERLHTAATLSLITALWCWLATALYSLWKFGIVGGYLAQGFIPFPSTIPINYLSFFMFTIGAFGVTFMIALFATFIIPPRWALIALWAAWLVGATLAAVDVSFVFLDHGGGTWLPREALRAQFFHPIITPFYVVLGLAGTASLTRYRRRAP